eukprot:TRINITY_DN2376_c0_g1_i1.p1 TRINITY_DN2376_c0_g1~~TRINITY_DN2376_c0_g1_i1.p1  ORF type:complete len:202 (-),score=47.25 TRINITY_DN2376_c0_g1_i1:588-1172(-)
MKRTFKIPSAKDVAEARFQPPTLLFNANTINVAPPPAPVLPATVPPVQVPSRPGSAPRVASPYFGGDPSHAQASPITTPQPQLRKRRASEPELFKGQHKAEARVRAQLVQPPAPASASPRPSAQPSTVSAGQALLVNRSQDKNPALKHVHNVPWAYAEIEPDFLLSTTAAALFLSLRFHMLHPQYIGERLHLLK